MDQDKFVFTAIDWLAGILASAIVTGALCYATNAESKARFYRYGWIDGSKATKDALDKLKDSKKNQK